MNCLTVDHSHEMSTLRKKKYLRILSNTILLGPKVFTSPFLLSVDVSK